MTEIGEIPEDWSIDKIHNLRISIYYGLTVKSTEEKTNLRLLRTTDISNFDFMPEELPYCIVAQDKSDLSKYYLKKDDIVIARAGTVGVSIRVKKDLRDTIFGSYLIKIVFNENLIDPSFVHYYFQSSMYWNKVKSAQGSTIKNLNIPFLESLMVPLPSLPEQQRIAEILSTADEVIQEINDQITQTERLKRGLMQTLLTRGIRHTKFKMTEIGEIPEEWEVSQLGKIFNIFTGTTPSTKVGKYWHSGSIEWFTPKDLGRMTDSIFISSSEKKITPDALKECSLNLIPEGSILISTRAPVGYVGVSKTKVTFNQGCKGLVPIELNNTDTSFYAYYLMYKRDTLVSNSSGSTFKELSKESLANLDVPVPSFSEQQRIAEILSTFDGKLELLRKKKERIEKLKRGLMEDLLTGRVRVKVPKEGDN